MLERFSPEAGERQGCAMLPLTTLHIQIVHLVFRKFHWHHTGYRVILYVDGLFVLNRSSRQISMEAHLDQRLALRAAR
jgi:hypothetical protein